MAEKKYIDWNLKDLDGWDILNPFFSYSFLKSEGFEGFVGGTPEPDDVIVTLGASDFDEPVDQVWSRLQSGETVAVASWPKSTIRLTKEGPDAQAP